MTIENTLLNLGFTKTKYCGLYEKTLTNTLTTPNEHINFLYFPNVNQIRIFFKNYFNYHNVCISSDIEKIYHFYSKYTKKNFNDFHYLFCDNTMLKMGFYYNSYRGCYEKQIENIKFSIYKAHFVLVEIIHQIGKGETIHHHYVDSIDEINELINLYTRF